MPSLSPPRGRGAEVPRVALLGTLLPPADAPSLKARLGSPKQLYFPTHPPNIHRLQVSSWKDCEDCVCVFLPLCARARACVCVLGAGNNTLVFSCKGWDRG